MRILVVDDEKDIKILFEQKFRKEIRSGAYIFLFAFSGEEALYILNTDNQADLALILSDINMPGMNGLELLKYIKDKYSHLKVAMITAYGDEHNFKKAHEYGCDGYLTKPLDFSDLKTKVFAELT